ncbi:hypothetical protein HAX54_007918 [Datura stramonium]|uniref:Uncharacterized protein n=1 Tax=Datura stramonium TaxID=4076 RepID=A0ABS8TDW6_DATST|nr:hypothetical protein [Datura stramonium]
MKGSCTLVTFVLAASTVVTSSISYASSSVDPDVTFHSPSTKGFGYSSLREKLRSNKPRKLSLTSEKEKFAPRFDSLSYY